MLMRMRSVVNAVKVTVRLTRLLPLTVASVTQAAPLQPCDREVGDAVAAEGQRVGGLDRIGVVVLHRIDDDPVDGLAAVEIDLHPVREDVGGGVVPAAAVAPVDAGALVVVDAR